MVYYFTNREIAGKLEINLARWKRWSRSFLPPDPLGGLQSGYARQYTFKDLCKVFLGGHLVSHLKLSVPDAQQILADLSPWLKMAGFLDLNGSMETPAKGAGRPTYRIFLRRLPLADGAKGPRFGYLIRKTVSSQSFFTSSRLRMVETVEETIVNCDIPDGTAFLEAPEVHMINLSALISQLIDRSYHQEA
jgi:hypothetical protein